MRPRTGALQGHSAKGFTLVEIGVVLLIVGLLVGAIAIPLTTRLESRRIEDTARFLDLAQEKLLAYASKHGYFPCPATDTSNGQEPATANHTTGVCPQYHGYLPAAVLGWTPLDAQGYAVDAWGTAGSRIRYAVSSDPIDGITAPFTRVNGLANAGTAAVGAATLFRICGSGSGVNAGVDCGTAPTLASNAAIVVWSVGPNAVTGGTNIHEAQNPNPNGGSADRIFVSRPRSSGGTDPDYDDVVRWMPGPIVSGRLQVAGMMTPTGSGTGGTGGGGGTYGNNDSDDDDGDD